MRKQNENIEDKDKNESTPKDDYIKIYTQIVRELNENLKNRKELGEDIVSKKIDLYKSLHSRKRIQHHRNQKKMLKYINTKNDKNIKPY